MLIIFNNKVSKDPEGGKQYHSSNIVLTDFIIITNKWLESIKWGDVFQYHFLSSKNDAIKNIHFCMLIILSHLLFSLAFFSWERKGKEKEK